MSKKLLNVNEYIREQAMKSLNLNEVEIVKLHHFAAILICIILQGVPKVRSSTLKVCISVRLNLLSKSLKQKLCLSI